MRQFCAIPASDPPLLAKRLLELIQSQSLQSAHGKRTGGLEACGHGARREDGLTVVDAPNVVAGAGDLGLRGGLDEERHLRTRDFGRSGHVLAGCVRLSSERHSGLSEG